MIAGEYNIAVRTGRRLHRRFGFGPDSNPLSLAGAVLTGIIVDAAGDEQLLLADYLTVFTDADGNDWVDLDIPLDDIDENVTASGEWELVIDLGDGPETYLEGAIVHVVSRL